MTAACAEPGNEIEIEIRGKTMKGRVVPLPFCVRRAKEEAPVLTYSPYELRYTSSHVWVRPAADQDRLVTLGLTDFGQRCLGDILSIDLPKIGDKIASGAAVAWLDTYRKAFELLAPGDLEVIAVNEELLKNPTQINATPYSHTGIVKAKMAAGCDYKTMMTFAEYTDEICRARRYDTWSAELRLT